MFEPSLSASRRARVTSSMRMSLCLALVLGTVLVLAPAALAASTYTGGPTINAEGYADCPLFIANDHSVNVLRFAASGLVDDFGVPVPAGTTLYVKIRLSSKPLPSGAVNRGFTWNPATGRWAQEREAWTSFPTITTTADGAYVPGSDAGWFYFKFGDTGLAGTYYLVISLSTGVSSDTKNNAGAPAVTVMDMSGTAAATPGFSVHNGAATGAAAAKRVAAAATIDTVKYVYALSRTERNGVDDDANGADDEDWGPAGATGDFRLAVPSGTAFDLMIQKSVWPAGAPSFTGSLADVDIALGASDQTAPSAPAGLTATATSRKVELDWTDASDDTGVTAYKVYRWTAAPAGSPFTPVHAVVATVTDGTTFTDTGVTMGTAYSYEVRAVDAATNVGPRSATAAATVPVDAAAPTTTALLPDVPASGWYQAPVDVVLTAQDNADGLGVSGISYVLDGTQTDVAGPGPVVVPVSGDGEHTLSYWATDGVNTEAANGPLAIRIDGTAPITTAALTGDLVNGWYNGPVTVALAASDNADGSGVARTHYSVDGGEPLAYAEPFAVTGDGSHTVTFWSVDAAGNVEDGSAEANRVTFVIDTTAPSVTAPATLTFTRGVGAPMPYVRVLVPYSITDAWSATADVRLTISSGNVKHKHPGATQVFTFPDTPADGSPVEADLTLKLKRGTYRYTISAVDEAGNASLAYGGRITVE